MKPILFETTATTFTTNGIGILNDVISCVVTQQRNGIYETEIKYPMFGGIHFEEIKMRSIILVLPDNMSDPQPMRVYSISKPMKGIVTINCRHLAYDLMGIVVSPFSATSIQEAFVNMKSAAVTDCPFTFYTDKTTVANMNVEEPSSIWSLLGGTEGSFLDVYGGGEYEFDKYAIKLYQNRGYNRGVEIRYGKNLTDLTQEQNCEAVYTGVYPYYMDQEDGLLQLPEHILNASGTYNFSRIYPLDLTDQWEEKPTVAQLRARAQKYMTDNDIGIPKVSLEVEFVSLEQTEEYKDIVLLEQVGLCDTVSVYFEEMNVTATAKVNEIRFNSILERYESIVLGDIKHSLADTMAAQNQVIKEKPSETFMRSAIMALTASILGAQGGAVRMLDTNDDGYPDTLYIADNPEPTQAHKVWRFNYEGWGASTNGFNGPFTLGATLNDGIVADFITTGVLNAALIKTGLLQDYAGKNYWNMQTGEFALASTTTVGGSTVSSIANTAATAAATTAVNGQTQQSIFNKLTNNGQTQGIYLSNGLLYLNATYMNTGTLNANLITTGSMSAARITTGKITSNNGRVYFDLDNNELACSAIRTAKPFDSTTGTYMGDIIVDIGGQWHGNTIYYTYLDVYKDGYSTYGCRIEPPKGGSNPTYFYSQNGFDFRPGATYYYSNTNGRLVLETNEVCLYVTNGSNNYGVFCGSSYGTSISGPCNTDALSAASLTVRGSKNRVIETEDYGERLMDTYELTSPMFGDVGSGVTDSDGYCIIAIDDIFREVARCDIEYQVFLQKEGPGDIWVSEKTASYFTVQGTPNLKFSWEMKAKQRDFELNRTERYEKEIAIDNDPTYLYSEEIDELFDEFGQEVEDESA